MLVVLLLLEVEAFLLLVVARAVLIGQELLGVLSSVVFFLTALIMVFEGILTMRKHSRVCIRIHSRRLLQGEGRN